MKIQKAVALRVSNLLMEKGLSKYAYINKIAMNKSTLRNILEERYEEVKFSTMVRLADGFDMSIQEFIQCDLFKRDNLDVD